MLLALRHHWWCVYELVIASCQLAFLYNYWCWGWRKPLCGRQPQKAGKWEKFRQSRDRCGEARCPFVYRYQEMIDGRSFRFKKRGKDAYEKVLLSLVWITSRLSFSVHFFYYSMFPRSGFRLMLPYDHSLQLRTVSRSVFLLIIG